MSKILLGWYDFNNTFLIVQFHLAFKGGCGCDRMVVGFTTTYAINVYQHGSYMFESHSWRGVLDTTLCDKVCQ